MEGVAARYCQQSLGSSRGEVVIRRWSYCRQTFCRLSLRSRCTKKGAYVACHLGRIVMTFSHVSGHNVASTSTSHCHELAL